MKRVFAGVLLFLFLGINLVASSHRLHKAIHPDATAPTHDCVFVRVLTGHCVVESPPILVVAKVQETTVGYVEFSQIVLPSREYTHLPGRAPPFRQV